MPRTIEHITEMHRLATERRNTGKRAWAHTVDVSSVWRDFDEEQVNASAQSLAALLKASAWYKAYDEFSDLHQAVEELGDADTMEWFDAVWDGIYDLADYDRVWVKTRGV